MDPLISPHMLKSKDSDAFITVRGARVHNLKNISTMIPRDQLIVITGPSGSGKSSLAFDTIYAEGQRRYIESLSTYARQFLEQMDKPEVDLISGLSPTICIEQKTTTDNPRSTVGTVTELHDYIRLLYARIAKAFCWKCQKPILSQSSQQIADFILTAQEGSCVSILAPVVRGRKGEYQKELNEFRKKGFIRIKIDGKIFDLADDIDLEKNKKHEMSLYVDRLMVKNKKDFSSFRVRIVDSVEQALKLAGGLVLLETQEHGKIHEKLFSQKFACSDCHVSYPTPEPRTFSFNSPLGSCPECHGLGVYSICSKNVKSVSKTLLNKDEEVKKTSFEDSPCPLCEGTRFKKEVLHFKVNGLNVAEVSNLSIEEALLFFQNLQLIPREHLIAERITVEIIKRLQFLMNVGVGYLTLARSSQSLSGGETQRIRLATQIGSALVGVIYVLDEPSIGLHQKDNEKLIATLVKLRDLGNTVIVVEHDRDIMECSDWILDLGPGAGTHGGSIIAEGKLTTILNSKESLTGQYLRSEAKIPLPKKRRSWQRDKILKIEGAKKNNLKNLTVEIPIGLLTCLTGVSGSGKSTLVMDTLYPLLMQKLYGSQFRNYHVQKISGIEYIDKVIDIDQAPIGKTPRSNPATYTGLFTHIRELFSGLPESMMRGYGPGRYSFNMKGGRCDHCEGDGETKVQMHFLPNVSVRCNVCHGKRYHRDILEVRYKGKNIAEILEMTASDAALFFDAIPSLKAKLKVLNEVGLGYLHLGQSAPTLSGGEAQRIKLAKELSKRSTGKTLYILDEPSTGLHFDDINKLIQLLQALVDQGNTVVIIEHHLDIIKVADHIIDLGPVGGGGGGYIIASGTPEEISCSLKSETGRFLKPYLKV